ncbi:MAG TPA: flagellar basal body rod protein FlgB [Kiloniellales bacterium]|jgi:flagellar basal-body rod protein FlgB
MEGKFNIFDVIGKRMDWLNQRERVLANNIANSDTPQYVPRDLDGTKFARLLQSQLAPVEPVTTDRAHLNGTVVRDGPAKLNVQHETYEASPTGNAVVLEEQLIKVSETQSAFQLMTNLYRKHMDMFRIALRGPNG